MLKLSVERSGQCPLQQVSHWTLVTLFSKDEEPYGLFGLYWVKNSELICKAKFIMYLFSAVPHPTPSFHVPWMSKCTFFSVQEEVMLHVQHSAVKSSEFPDPVLSKTVFLSLWQDSYLQEFFIFTIKTCKKIPEKFPSCLKLTPNQIMRLA